MKRQISQFLRHLRLLRFDLLTDRSPSLPDNSSIVDQRLTIVESDGVKKWACFRCPGGCGELINLSLNPNQRPRWTVSEDFWMRPTVNPSVHQQNACGCHFWIKQGHVHWCKGGLPRLNSTIGSIKRAF
ncbi:DUF6527 family protein [uncultured Roseibium sp.]|uniref:DUF6527 family protein n=1 Tax=uncultured Roseibium sp. TaxID=1936171 RepID=UPI0026367348|nr:DUF6527 family protein [uncultured Roseibium sp.]